MEALQVFLQSHLSALLAESLIHCVQVFPQLYLPVMAEANLRSIRPWRPYIPTPSFFMFHWRVRQLNSYIRQLLRQRWNDRSHRSGTAKLDILDRLLNAIEVCITDVLHLPVQKSARPPCLPGVLGLCKGMLAE